MTRRYDINGLGGFPNDDVALDVAEAAADGIEKAGRSVIWIRGVKAHEALKEQPLKMASVMFLDRSGEKAQVDLRFYGELAGPDDVASMVGQAVGAYQTGSVVSFFREK